MNLAEVRLWGRTIGAVSQGPDVGYATFQYDEDFAESGIQVSPLTMPLARHPYAFPQLPRRSFNGLPGLLSDSLPDYFGSALINAWLSRQGRNPDDFRPIERLCYVGTRGMGALEFKPSIGPRPTQSRKLEVDALVDLASRILGQRGDIDLSVAPGIEESSLNELFRVGTSAGGARAKALIAWNPETNEVRSGQIHAGSGFEYWILKFDGVSGNPETGLTDPEGYGRIEYGYSMMAREAGIAMSDCRLFEENGRCHFITRRFDRTAERRKIHMLSLGALSHLDFNAPGVHGYEQALMTIRSLGLPMDAIEEQYRRMVFNVLARNQDDHVKNIAFLMDKHGQWSLAPAFDVIYAYNPSGVYTTSHQMTVNGKVDGFSLADFEAVARGASMKRGRAAAIHEEVHAVVSRWLDFAERAGVEESRAERIQNVLRLALPKG